VVLNLFKAFREVIMQFKEDMDKMAKKYQPAVKEAGKQLTKAVKEAEEEMARVYKTVQAQIEIQMTKVQKEKLYHTIGKEAADMMLKGELEIPVFDKYIEKLKALDVTTKKKKLSIAAISRSKRKKSSTSKKGSQG
jgi:hypothetical protein